MNTTELDTLLTLKYGFPSEDIFDLITTIPEPLRKLIIYRYHNTDVPKSNEPYRRLLQITKEVLTEYEHHGT
jgi:hypothetical protein